MTDTRSSQDEKIIGLDVIEQPQHGPLTVVGSDRPRHIPTSAKDVFDVSGAGDTAIAVLATGLAAGGTPLEAAELANRASGIVVGKLGTATVTIEELRMDSR